MKILEIFWRKISDHVRKTQNSLDEILSNPRSPPIVWNPRNVALSVECVQIYISSDPNYRIPPPPKDLYHSPNPMTMKVIAVWTSLSLQRLTFVFSHTLKKNEFRGNSSESAKFFLIRDIISIREMREKWTNPQNPRKRTHPRNLRKRTESEKNLRKTKELISRDEFRGFFAWSDIFTLKKLSGRPL